MKEKRRDILGIVFWSISGLLLTSCFNLTPLREREPLPTKGTGGTDTSTTLVNPGTGQETDHGGIPTTADTGEKDKQDPLEPESAGDDDNETGQDDDEDTGENPDMTTSDDGEDTGENPDMTTSDDGEDTGENPDVTTSDNNEDPQTDSEVDSEVETGESTERSDSLDLIPDETGWIDDTTNALGIQGAWYTYADDGYSDIQNEGTCTWGTIAQVVEDEDGELMWDYIWGAGVAFNVCLLGENEDPPEEMFTLSTCPLNDNLVNEFLGISFTITGDIGPLPLRVTFAEGEQASAYVEIESEGDHIALIEDATIGWDVDGDYPPANAYEVHSVQFALATTDEIDYEFDFCVTNIQAITN